MKFQCRGKCECLPQAGRILIDGNDVADYDLGSLRGSIGLVTQNVHILEGTVRENLAFFDTTVTDQRIHGAFEALGLQGWLEHLPDGLDTRLESGGGGLSSGEAQLLAFARIFLLQDPCIVILDEASSAIDPATERMLVTSVRRLVSGRTAMIIAHRLSTVALADEIMVLEAGRVAEHGPRTRLEQDPQSRYSLLVRSALTATSPDGSQGSGAQR